MAALLMALPIVASAETAKPAGEQDKADPAQSIADRAYSLLEQKRLVEALNLLDEGIADQERQHADGSHLFYSAHSPTQMLLYAGMGASQKKDVIVLDGDWSEMLFLKAYVLIDLGRADEAKTYLDKAIALSPMHAHFISELGEWYKTAKDWPHAYQYFEQAFGVAGLGPSDTIVAEKCRALRGMGYALTEQGKLKEAEKSYRACLKLDPQDRGSKTELTYIKDLSNRPGN